MLLTFEPKIANGTALVKPLYGIRTFEIKAAPSPNAPARTDAVKERQMPDQVFVELFDTP